MRYLFRFFAFLFAATTLVFVVGAGAAGFFIWKYSKELPDYTQLSNYEPPVTTRVHAGDGSLVAEYSIERRLYLPIQAVPKLVVDAFLSAEDKNFWSHGGVDAEGVLRAVRAKLLGGRQQGGSTITQQVAKNFLVGNEQTIDRKIREALTALRIESTFTKERILELYLNEIYLGMGNYGIAAASLNYFNKSTQELTLAEAAYLAALPKGPNNYNPIEKRDAAIARRNWVLDRMVENGVVTREAGASAKAEDIGYKPRNVSPNDFAAGFFVEEVRRELSDRYGWRKLNSGGLSVRTTLDPAMQLMARKALVDGLVRYDEARGWRGPSQRVEVAGRDWGPPLLALPAYGDVRPWRFAVVLDAADGALRVGLQPDKDRPAERVTGTLTADGTKWTRKSRLRDIASVGDVVYVEPLDDKPGQYRLRQVPEISGAIVALDPNTGRVFAMVGGFSFDQSEFNRATQAQRQPGSSFKPFVYATALDNGYTPSSLVDDAPIEITNAAGETWRPENYDGKSTGTHTLRYGVEHSKNLMTVRLARDVGMPLIIDYAKRFGIYDDLAPYLPMSLGAGETTVMRMTAGYAMFANGGRRIKPTLIDRIQDRFGRTIYKHDERECPGCTAEAWNGQAEPKLVDKREQVIDPLTAYQITSIMEGVIQRGTAQVVKELNRPLAGKTGTTNDAKDVWFVGFSPDLAVGVYLGYDKPRSLGDSATAGHYAAPVFRDFMRMALKDKPATPFRIPAGLKLIRVSARSGQRAGAGEGGGTILEGFKPGTAPPEGGGGGPRSAGVSSEPDRGVSTGGLY